MSGAYNYGGRICRGLITGGDVYVGVLITGVQTLTTKDVV